MSAVREPSPSAPAVAAPGASSALRDFLVERRQWVMVAMLFLLHYAVLLDIHDPWTRALLIAHIGAFLLWQPLWRGEREITPGGLAVVVAAAATILFYLNWWLLALWITILASLVGGKVFAVRARWARAFDLAVTVYLLSVLLLWVVPHLFSAAALPDLARWLMWFAFPLALLALILVPSEKSGPGGQQIVDFFYSLLLFMVVVLLVLGSFAFMALTKTGYLEALIRTLFVMAAALVVLGVLWNPRYGRAVLQPVVLRYLLNVGTPFEQWLAQTAGAAEAEQNSAGFLKTALRNLADLPWVGGVAWNSPDGWGEMGQKGRHAIQVRSGPLELEICSKYSLSPALTVHLHLLSAVIGHFYEAKRREQALRRITRLQAIYETGSRVTHDVKNLLQSLYTLASAAQQPGEAPAFQRLMQRQLPDLARRLELTLGKLQDPRVLAEASGQFMAADAWWEALKGRFDGRGIEFRDRFAGEPPPIPAAVFDCVAENLLDNALKKAQSQPETKVTVAFDAGESIKLSVCDSGTVIPEDVASRLFEETLSSRTGLGVGLYQASRFARQHGYRLRLARNRDGEVCFELAPALD